MWGNRRVSCVSRVLCAMGFGLALFPRTGMAADPPVGPEASNPACDATPKMIDFRATSARLSPDAKVVLDEVVVWTKAAPDRSLRLRGPAPATAETTAKTAAANRLNLKRANSVKAYLTQHGVDTSRIIAADQPESAASTMAAAATGLSLNAVEIATCSPVVALAPSPPPSAAVATTDPTTGLPAVPPVPANSAGVPAIPAPAPPVTAENTPAMVPPAPTTPQPNDYTPTEPSPAQDDRPHSKIGVGTTIGGGVIGFVDQNARAFTSAGGSWETRVSAGTRTFVALEAAYIGSAQNINALGLSDARLIGNGAEGDLRVNLTRKMVQPYLFGGLGWDHYKVSTSGANTSSLRDSDDVLTVPFGVGLSLRVAKSVLIDVRGTARAAFYDDLMDGPYAASGQDAKLHTWNVGGRLGWEF